jgi:hypothetical protein
MHDTLYNIHYIPCTILVSKVFVNLCDLQTVVFNGLTHKLSSFIILFDCELPLKVKFHHIWDHVNHSLKVVLYVNSCVSIRDNIVKGRCHTEPIT